MAKLFNVIVATFFVACVALQLLTATAQDDFQKCVEKEFNGMSKGLCTTLGYFTGRLGGIGCKGDPSSSDFDIQDCENVAKSKLPNRKDIVTCLGRLAKAQETCKRKPN